MVATKEEMRIEFAFFGEVWNFFKKFYYARADDSYWEAVVNEALAINEKYNSQLCKDLLVAVEKELQRKGDKLHETV